MKVYPNRINGYSNIMKEHNTFDSKKQNRDTVRNITSSTEKNEKVNFKDVLNRMMTK